MSPPAQNMKNTLPALLSFTVLSAPLVATAQLQFGDFYYTYNGSAVTITGYAGRGGAVVIPASVIGFPVVAIGDNAFSEDGSGDFAITSVTIPSSVTSIGFGAFAQSHLTNVTIPGSVTQIGEGAFGGCFDLTTINVDEANTSYGSADGVLFNKSLSSLLICPAGKVGRYAIPGSVMSIVDGAFNFCYLLTSVTIPGQVTNIGQRAFWGCIGLTSVAIPSSVTNIGYEAFYSCTAITNLTIMGGVTSIGESAFQSCTSLINVTIPGSVVSIGVQAFGFCDSLQGVFFSGDVPEVGSNAFSGTTNATVYYLPGSTGWGTTLAGRPAVLWNPLMQSSGVGPAGFGFNITGTADIPIVVEASTNLGNASWVPLQNLNLTNGAFYFSDPTWTNYPARNYRLRSP
jgi:hypothetical protein